MCILTSAPRSVSAAVTIALSLASVVLAPSVSWAQGGQSGRMRGPFSGLFGGGQPSVNQQTLSLRGSLFGIAQNVEFPEDLDPDLVDPRLQTTQQSFAGASTSINYLLRRKAGISTMGLGGTAFAANYSIAPDKPQFGGSTNGSVGISTKLTRRITFTASGQGSYSSQYSFTPLSAGGGFTGGTGIDPISLNDPLVATSLLGNAPLLFNVAEGFGSAGLSASVTRRGTASVLFAVRRSHFFGDLGPFGTFPGFSTISSTASYSHRIVRNLSARVGYRTERPFLIENNAQPRIEGFEFGLDLNDGLQLQLTRRTTLAMAVSLGSFRQTPGTTQYRVLGSATLTHGIGRTWAASANISRNLLFAPAFAQPTLMDMAMATLGGQLAPRVSLTGSGGFTRGYVGLDTSRSFDLLSAAAVLNVALTRRIALFGQYSLYSSEVPPDVSQLPLFNNFKRNGLVVGLTFWAPLYNRPRVRQ